MIPRAELLQVRRIASRDNPRVRMWGSLGDRKGRDASGLTLAEGARLAREGLDPEHNPAAMLRPAVLLVSDSGAEHAMAGELFRMAEAVGVERVSLADPCFAKISTLKNSDGLALVLALAGEEVELADRLREIERWVVADGVQDPGNAGALARTALAAGWGGCLFVGGVDPASPKFLRGAMGASYRIPCIGVARGAFAEVWELAGSRLLLADSGQGGLAYDRVDYGGRLALAIGGETGISDEVGTLAKERVHIPLLGRVESLNLSVAAGIILFEAGRDRRAGTAPKETTAPS